MNTIVASSMLTDSALRQAKEAHRLLGFNFFVDHPTSEQLTVSDLVEALVRDYTINRCRSLRVLKYRWGRHLQPFFGELPAALVSTDQITRYVVQRQQKEGAAKVIIYLTD